MSDELAVCEIPDCGRHVWGSEAVCRPHLLRGVTAEKLERRAQFLAEQDEPQPLDADGVLIPTPAEPADDDTTGPDTPAPEHTDSAAVTNPEGDTDG